MRRKRSGAALPESVRATGPKEPCRVGGCSKARYAKELCTTHYQRWVRTGRLDNPRGHAPVVERLLRRVEVDPVSGCWLWTGPTLRGNYGSIRENGRTRAVHRVAYEHMVGLIPDGLELDHLCHDPAVCTLSDVCPHRRCCNPDHLRPSTYAENHAPERNALLVSTGAPCWVGGCTAVAFARDGLCRRHHERVRKHGAIDGGNYRASVVERLLRHVEIDPVSGCWVYCGSEQISTLDGPRRVRVVAFEQWVGPTNGRRVRGCAGDTRCVCPEHLALR